jgi:UTP--glucose-1-phosphate uridylyltransferase
MVMAATPCLKQMVMEYNRVGGNLVAVMDVPREHTDRYGVLETGREEGRLVEVRGLVEKPKPKDAPSTLSIIGRYILQPEVFDLIAEQSPGAGGEVQLTDALARMIGRGPFHGFRFEGKRFDCGDKAGFIEATIAYALKHEVIGGKVGKILRDYARQLDI